MKTFLIVSFLTSIYLLQTQAQDSMKVNRGIEPIVHRKTHGDLMVTKTKTKQGKTIVSYSDKENRIWPWPQGDDDNRLELISFELNSREVLNDIEKKIFTLEEIKYLGQNHARAFCVTASDGQIINVRFVFNWDPDVTIQKLTEYAQAISEKVSWDLHFSQQVAKQGYVELSIGVFCSLNLPHGCE